MSVTGYKPGKPIATGQAATWKSGITRVVCSYTTVGGELVGYSAGSGFVLDFWPGIVLTARHVVMLPPAIPAQRMSVVVGAPGAGDFDEVDALGVAYPTAFGSDVAAILIPGAAGATLPLADPLPVDQQQLDGVAAGYVRNQLKRLPSRVLRLGSRLRELDKPSIGGMSGGPVYAAAGVGSGNEGAFGIQSRDDHGQGIATLIDFDVLNDCALRAREFEP